MEKLRLSTNVQGEQASVTVEGELDITTAPQLRAELERAAADCEGDLTLDMAGVVFMDSSGLAVLMKVYRSLEASGRRLTITNPRDPIRRVLKITAVAELFGLTS